MKIIKIRQKAIDERDMFHKTIDELVEADKKDQYDFVTFFLAPTHFRKCDMECSVTIGTESFDASYNQFNRMTEYIDIKVPVLMTTISVSISQNKFEEYLKLIESVSTKIFHLWGDASSHIQVRGAIIPSNVITITEKQRD